MAAVACRPLPPLAVSGAVAVGGLGALLARPWLVEAGEGHTARLVLFLAIGGVGCWWPLPRTATAPLRLSLAVFALGSLAFTLGRLAVGPPPPSEDVAGVLVLNAVAAVAEEAFFRRLLYGLLLRWGTAVAVLASAAGFAVAHVTVWGLWVLPLDLAAGLVLSWQRAASGRWSVPAATHVVANTLAFL